MTIAEKEKAYRMATAYNLLGHRYIGFEGKKCSQMHSDDRKRTLEECAWVWDAQKKRWLKRPEETVNA